MTKECRRIVSCHSNEVCSSITLYATTMSSNTIIENFFNRSYFELASQKDANFTNTSDSYNATDVVVFAPAMYYLIGSLMTVIMVIGFSTNLTILYTYATNRKIRTVDNTLIIGLALSDIGQSVFGIPFVAISSFSKQWIFGHAFCQYYAFITTSFGIAQISMLTVIAMERYFVIVRHDRRLTNTPCRCVIIILFSFVYGSSWATGPLLGWSGYKEEEIGIACCVKWEIKDSIAFSYTISLCTFGWFIPLFLIAFGYISIACSIYHERNKRLYLRRQLTPNKTNRERKVAFTVLIMIGAFIVSWTPYSAVSLWSAVGDFQSIPLWVQVTPGVFAKCSIIWNPLIYVARHENFRQGVKQSLSVLKFWARDINHTDIGGRDTFQPSVNRRQGYKEIERIDTRNPLKQSITSDNYVTYVESPARSKSSSSVFYKSPASFKRHRLRRHLTFFSTLDSSQQITEKSETDGLDFAKRLVQCESKCTQTDYVLINMPVDFSKEVSHKCIQTDVSSLTLRQCMIDTSPSWGKMFRYNSYSMESAKRRNAVTENDSQFTCAIKSNEEGETDMLAVNHQPFEKSRNDYLTDYLESTEENGNDQEHSSIPLEYKSASMTTNPKIQKAKSLEALKKKRKVLKHQLAIIYQDKQPSDVLPGCSERQDLNTFRGLTTKFQSMQQRPAAEDRLKQMLSHTYKRIGADTDFPTRSDFDIAVQKRNKTSMPKRSVTYNRSLQPYYVQKREKYKERMNRERIASEPTGVEMQTYYYRPYANKVQTYREKDNKAVITAEKATIIRQSTV